MKKIIIILSSLYLIFFLFACQDSVKEKEDDKIWIIVQPKVELHKSISIKIYFKSKPDQGTVRVIQKSNNDFDLEGAEIENNIKSDGTNYYYDIIFTAV